MTEEQAKIEDERAEGFAREDEDESEMDVTATVDASTTEVLEGEIVAEEAEALEEGEEEIDELATLQQQLEATQAQADEYLDDLRRERAAFQNYKKRQENERAELRKMAVASLLNQILPALDDLQRALEAVPEDQSEQPWIAGILLIQRKLHTTLEAVGVVTVDAEPGQPFDPFIHEAVTYEEQEDRQEGEIIAVVQKGYKIGQRVLRPAMVRVAK